MSEGKTTFEKGTDQYADSEKLPPKFNAGLAKMIRIHELWRRCHLAKSDLTDENNMFVWYAALASLKGEFIDRVNDEDSFNAYEQSIDLGMKQGFGQLFKALLDYEFFLHKIEKQVGYSVPDKASIFDREV